MSRTPLNNASHRYGGRAGGGSAKQEYLIARDLDDALAELERRRDAARSEKQWKKSSKRRIKPKLVHLTFLDGRHARHLDRED